MITFLICLFALVAAYFLYGSYLERVCRVNASSPVPSASMYDGVDYMPLPRWKIFLIQLLNIAGLGPIFGALLGAAYGPVAFLWITLGAIFMGAMHDFVAAMMSLRQRGASQPEVVGYFLGDGARQFMRIFSALLMILVGAVFLSQPAELIASNFDIPAMESIAFGNSSWELLALLAVILIYYLLATLLPIDKIIGRIYPFFGGVLLVMAIGILFVLLTQSDVYQIPEFTSFSNGNANAEKFPIMPMLFTTIACGALSGFHATQSPMMVRCVKSERDMRPAFYGAMIAESIIALIWAAVAMAFWGGTEGLNNAIVEYGGSAAVMVDVITSTTLGPVITLIVLLGVVACAITTGDTAFRSARLIVADMLGIPQSTLRSRILLSLPLFALALVIIFALPFGVMWSYVAWVNQVLATITLWSIVVYLWRESRPIVIAFLPALIMTFVCASYIFVSPLMLAMSNRVAAYSIATVITIAILILVIYKLKHSEKSLY